MADSESVVVFTMVTQIRKKERLGDWLSPDDVIGGGNIALQLAEQICGEFDSLGDFLESIAPRQAAISVSVDGGEAGMAFLVWGDNGGTATTFLRQDILSLLSGDQTI